MACGRADAAQTPRSRPSWRRATHSNAHRVSRAATRRIARRRRRPRRRTASRGAPDEADRSRADNPRLRRAGPVALHAPADARLARQSRLSPHRAAPRRDPGPSGQRGAPRPRDGARGRLVGAARVRRRRVRHVPGRVRRVVAQGGVLRRRRGAQRVVLLLRQVGVRRHRAAGGAPDVRRRVVGRTAGLVAAQRRRHRIVRITDAPHSASHSAGAGDVSFHPNEVARRGRVVSGGLAVLFLLLLGAFFRTQIVENSRYALQSEENRLREVPLPAPRGIIYDRHNEVLAENVPGYSVSLLSPSADSLRASLQRLAAIIPLSPDEIDLSVRRYRRAPYRPTVVLSDASFNVVSMLEERRIEFPGLIIQSAPKRYYPDGAAVASFMGYVGEITESELATPQYRGYKSGQQVGKGGLEKQYEDSLRGTEGVRFVEVDARGRVVREAGARQDLLPKPGPPLQTNIDLELQKYVASLFADSLQGGAIALDPRTGGVLALYSAPSFDPNRFIGGIPQDLW